MAKVLLGPSTSLFPMPALLVAVKTGPASANVMTVAWAGIVGGNPPMMALEIGRNHHSTPFIEQEGSFTVNVPRSDMAVPVDYCGVVSGSQDPNKAATCGWTLLPSRHVGSPIIAQCPLNFECRVVQKVEAGEGAFYLVEILETHADDGTFGDKGDIDSVRLDPLVFTPDGWYHRLGERVARAFSAGKTLKRD